MFINNNYAQRVKQVLKKTESCASEGLESNINSLFEITNEKLTKV